MLFCITHTVSHNTTILSMSDKPLHWVQLHVSALGIGHNQVVFRRFEELYNKQGTLGEWGWWGEEISSPTTPNHPVYFAYCIVAR